MDASLLGRVETVQRGKDGDTLGRRDRPAVEQDVHHRGAGLDASRAPQHFVRELQEVGVQPDLPLPVRDDRLGVALLHLGAEMRLGDPRDAVAKRVGGVLPNSGDIILVQPGVDMSVSATALAT